MTKDVYDYLKQVAYVDSVVAADWKFKKTQVSWNEDRTDYTDICCMYQIRQKDLSGGADPYDTAFSLRHELRQQGYNIHLTVSEHGSDPILFTPCSDKGSLTALFQTIMDKGLASYEELAEAFPWQISILGETPPGASQAK